MSRFTEKSLPSSGESLRDRGLARLVWLNALSRATGMLFSWNPPGPLKGILFRLFVRCTGIDLSDSRKELKEFSSIGELFARHLRPGARPLGAGFVSPADGVVRKSGLINGGRAVQAKGLTYSANQLIDTGQAGAAPGLFATIYLAPKSYHRVHSPLDGDLLKIQYVPGTLCPVSPPFDRVVPDLFVRNERLVFTIEDGETGGLIWLVMVGGINVGKMASPYMPDFTTNSLDAPAKRRMSVERRVPLQKGDELGNFMLGSTVVLLFDKKFAQKHSPAFLPEGSPVLMGHSLFIHSGNAEL